MLCRHWDSWVNDKRPHLFVVRIAADGTPGAPRNVTPGGTTRCRPQARAARATNLRFPRTGKISCCRRRRCLCASRRGARTTTCGRSILRRAKGKISPRRVRGPTGCRVSRRIEKRPPVARRRGRGLRRTSGRRARLWIHGRRDGIPSFGRRRATCWRCRTHAARRVLGRGLPMRFRTIGAGKSSGI